MASVEGKSMHNDFFLVKITDYAEEFIKGKLFMNSLVNFRKGGFAEPTSALRGDCFDGLFAIYDFENLPPDGEFKDAILNYLNTQNKEYEKYGDAIKCSGVTHGGIGSPDDYRKMLCMYMLPFNKESKTITLPCKQLCEFGNKAVVVKNWGKFIQRVCNAVKDIGNVGYGVVEYTDKHGSLGILRKRSSYEWQSEFRFWVDENTKNIDRSKLDFNQLFEPINNEHLILDIGDISDIADLIETESLLNIEYYFDGNYTDTPSSYYERDAIFISQQVRSELFTLVCHNEPKGCEKHFRLSEKHLHNEDMFLAKQEIEHYYTLSLSNADYDKCVPFYFMISELYLRLAEDYSNINMEEASKAFAVKSLTYYMRAMRKSVVDPYLEERLMKIMNREFLNEHDSNERSTFSEFAWVEFNVLLSKLK